METSAIQDRENGLKAINYFHSYSIDHFPLTYKTTFAHLVKILDGRGKGGIAGVGLGIAVTNMDWGKVQEAMEKLASLAQGKIPSSNGAFSQALANRLQEIDFTALSEIALDSGLDLIKHSASIGDKAMEGLKGAFDLVSQAKIAIPLALGLYLVSKTYFGSKKKGKR